MSSGSPIRATLAVTLSLSGLLAVSGCGSVIGRDQGPEIAGAPSARQGNVPFRENAPTEKSKTTLATYVIEPPDILILETVKLVPKAPYHFEPLDSVQLAAPGALPEQPLSGQYPIDPSGTIDLGPVYGGRVKISGLTSDEAKEAVSDKLKEFLNEPNVSLTLLQSAGQQNISGEHLVGPDGAVHLGTYGSVYVAGMTLAEARLAIETRLAMFLDSPKVSVDVFAYNSKVYYIISEGAGNGDVVVRVPVTGNETVLDALTQTSGLSRYNSKHIWIARPAPGGVGCDQILPVDWNGITKGGATATNYQLLPGDRVFIEEDKLLKLHSTIDRIVGVPERIFGFSLLGLQTVQTANRLPFGFGGGTL